LLTTELILDFRWFSKNQ